MSIDRAFVQVTAKRWAPLCDKAQMGRSAAGASRLLTLSCRLAETGFGIIQTTCAELLRHCNLHGYFSWFHSREQESGL